MATAEIERRPEFTRLVAAHRVGWCSFLLAGVALLLTLCGWHRGDDSRGSYLAMFLAALVVAGVGQLWSMHGTRAALRSLHHDFDEADLRAADRLAVRIGALRRARRPRVRGLAVPAELTGRRQATCRPRARRRLRTMSTISGNAAMTTSMMMIGRIAL